MPKNSRLVNDSKKRPNVASKKGYDLFAHPLNGVSLEDRIQATRRAAELAERDYPNNLAELERLILDSQPLALLSIFSTDYLAQPAGVTPEWQEEEPVLQHHVELIQSLALKHKPAEFRREFPEIDQISTLAKLVCDQFWLRRQKDVSADQPESERLKVAFHESLRVHAQAVRNWGYPQHIRTILTDLWTPLNKQFEQVWGVKPTSLIAMMFGLIEQSEEKLHQHRKALRSVVRQKSASDAIGVYRKHFPLDETLDELSTPGLPLETVRHELIARSTQWLSYIVHGFCKPEFIAGCEETVDWAALQKVLALWSTSFGATAETNTDHLFMGSPIREKPFINISPEYYYLPIPGLLLSYADSMLEQLCVGNKQLKDAYDHRRGRQFLEEDLHSRLTKAFPRGQVHRGSFYSIGPDLFENDILVVIDSYAIIIEAKAAHISDSAKRAGPRLKNAVEDIVEAPAKQALRFQKYLEENRGVLNFKTNRGVTNTVDTTNIKHFLRLAVVMDDISLTWKWAELKNAGLIKSDLEPIPVLFLADLHVILEMLDRASDKIHYFERRTWLERNVHYEGDELDLLAFYFNSGLRFNFEQTQSEFESYEIHVTGASQLFQSYLMAPSLNKKVKKRKPKMTDWMEQLLNRVESLEQPRWTEIGQLLLNIEFTDQQTMLKKIRVARKKLLKQPGPAFEHITFRVTWTSPDQLFVVLIHKNYGQAERNQVVKQICEGGFNQTTARIATALAFEPTQGDFSKHASLFFVGKAERTQGTIGDIAVTVAPG